MLHNNVVCSFKYNYLHDRIFAICAFENQIYIGRLIKTGMSDVIIVFLRLVKV